MSIDAHRTSTRKRLRPHAVRNNGSGSETTAADPLRFTPEQPQRTDSHGSVQPRCLPWGELRIPGGVAEARERFVAGLHTDIP
ncbi:MAG: hypothetical protein PVI71_16795 [Desulfobacterales bacterium]